MELILKNWDTQGISLNWAQPVAQKAIKNPKLNVYKVWYMLHFGKVNKLDSYQIIEQLGLKTNAFWVFFIEEFLIQQKKTIKCFTQMINQYYIFGQNITCASIHKLRSFVPEELRLDFNNFFNREFLPEVDMVDLDEVTLCNADTVSFDNVTTIYLDHFVLKSDKIATVGIKYFANNSCFYEKREISINQLNNWLGEGVQNILAQNAVKFLKANMRDLNEKAYYFRVHYEQYLKIETAYISL